MVRKQFKFIKVFVVACALGLLASCGGGGGGISILPTTDAFDNDGTAVNPKMDILWVVDPSRSMYNHVEKVRNNIAAFAEEFIVDGYEYRMAVVSTSAWSDQAYEADPTSFSFLQGPDGKPAFNRMHKGECVDRTAAPGNADYLDHLNAQDVGTFLAKFGVYFDVYGAQLGTSGCGLVGPPFGSYEEVPNNFFENSNGYTVETRSELLRYINDERPLQSLESFLDQNAASFVRDGAHLAVVIISDEIDASRDSLAPSAVYDPENPGNHTATQYMDVLRTYKTNDTDFSIFTIADLTLEGNIAVEMADLSGGRAFDINSTQQEYIDNLNEMKQEILTLSSFYPFDGEPVVSTISVKIKTSTGESITVPEDSGDGNGWTYDAEANGVYINGDYTPKKGDLVFVNYTPASFGGGSDPKLPRLVISNTSIDENAVDGTELGTVTLENKTNDGGMFSIADDTTAGAFSIDPVSGLITLVDTSKTDAEVKGLEQIRVELDLSGEIITRTFYITIADELDAVPVANDDFYQTTENAADASGVITINGNLTYNDQGVDSSESHTYTQVAALSRTDAFGSGTGSVSVHSDGTYTYTVSQTELDLETSEVAELTFTYEIKDSTNSEDPLAAGDNNPGGPGTCCQTSNVATVNIEIEGFNNPPESTGDIPDQTESGSEVSLIKIPILAADITSSGWASGDAQDLIDESASTSATTSAAAGAYHDITFNFPNNELYELDHIVIDGNQNLGNMILQVISPEGDVILREVLDVAQGEDLEIRYCGDASAGSVCLERKSIGSAIRLLRPYGAVNDGGSQDLSMVEFSAYGILVEPFDEVRLEDYFNDPDGMGLAFYLTDQYGEGPAPSWISTEVRSGDGTYLVALPPAGASATIGILAEDSTGATAFQTMNVSHSGASSGDPTEATLNFAPFALLPIEDEKRGGVTLKRFGAGNSGTNQEIGRNDADNFLAGPLDGQDIIDAIAAGGQSDLRSSSYQTLSNIPAATQSLMPERQLYGLDGTTLFGDGSQFETGWSVMPLVTNEKYPAEMTLTACDVMPLPGRIMPCANTQNYGETYTGFFVPAKTGVYRFRTNMVGSNSLSMTLAPSEYHEDLVTLFAAAPSNGNFADTLESIVPGITGNTTEFATIGAVSQALDTQIFFEGDLTSYQDGYAYLKQGNVYVLEIRFMNGQGNNTEFSFEFDRKDQGSSAWDGWRPLDASVVVPSDGADAYTPLMIDATASVSFDAASLFFDPEGDLLEYTARLVNPDGSTFGSGSISEIGLSLDADYGQLTGTLNATYDSAVEKPRIVFKAKEKFTNDLAEVEYLAIKFQK